MYSISNKDNLLTIFVMHHLICKMEILTSVFLPVVFNPLSF